MPEDTKLDRGPRHLLKVLDRLFTFLFGTVEGNLYLKTVVDSTDSCHNAPIFIAGIKYCVLAYHAITPLQIVTYSAGNELDRNVDGVKE